MGLGGSRHATLYNCQQGKLPDREDEGEADSKLSGVSIYQATSQVAEESTAVYPQLGSRCDNGAGGRVYHSKLPDALDDSSNPAFAQQIKRNCGVIGPLELARSTCSVVPFLRTRTQPLAFKPHYSAHL